MSIIIHFKIKDFKEKPRGFQNIIELIVQSMDNFVTTSMGEKYAYFGNWFFGVFTFIILSNYSGLLALRPPTASLGTTLALGLSTFGLIHFMGIFKNGKGYFKEFFEPMPLMFPLNVIGDLAIPISLSFRLFGNILGGLIVLSLMYGLFPFILRFGVPAFAHMYFDLFAGGLQAFIFTILSMTFIKSKIGG